MAVNPKRISSKDINFSNRKINVNVSYKNSILFLSTKEYEKTTIEITNVFKMYGLPSYIYFILDMRKDPVVIESRASNTPITKQFEIYGVVNGESRFRIQINNDIERMAKDIIAKFNSLEMEQSKIANNVAINPMMTAAKRPMNRADASVDIANQDQTLLEPQDLTPHNQEWRTMISQ